MLRDDSGRAPAAGDPATPLSQARYGYDGLGRRVWKQVEHQGQPPELTVFSWDGDLLQSEERFQGRLPVLHDTAPPLALALEKPERKLSTPVAQRVHSLDTAAMVPQRRVIYLFEPGSFIPAAKLEADYQAIHKATGSGTVLYSDYRLSEPQLYYFQTDHLGTPLEVSDTHGRLAWVGHYRAWGNLDKARDGNGNPAATDNPFRFQGQYHDEETGLHYNRHRYYDPEVGRFTTQDPIGLVGGENLYQYAPNPTGWVDPLGLTCRCDYSSRNAALRAAKRDAGIPMGQQPSSVDHVPLTDRNGKPILGGNNFPVQTREYTYSRPGEEGIVIQDHSHGHQYGPPGTPGNQGSHINIRPMSNTRSGSVPGTQDHYSFGD